MTVNLGSELERLAHSQGGVFTKTQAASFGMTSHDLRRLIWEGLCTRPIRGGYAVARDAPPSARHLDRLRLALLLDVEAAASHHSALLAMGIATCCPDYDTIHLLRPVTRTKRASGIHVTLVVPRTASLPCRGCAASTSRRRWCSMPVITVWSAPSSRWITPCTRGWSPRPS